MAVGLSVVNLADKWLNTLGGAGAGTTFTAITSWVKLHIGDPTSAGAGSPSVGSTTRVTITYAASASGVKAMNGTLPVWTNGGTSETLSHISIWDAVTTGNFMFSGALTTPQAWASGNTFTLSSLSISLTPLAA